MAGALVAFSMGGYYFFVWRKVLKHLERPITNPNLGNGFRLFLYFYYMAEFGVSCCYVSSWIGGILLSNLGVGPIQIVLLAIYLVDQLLLQVGIYDKYPRPAFSLTFLLNILGAVAFFIYCQVSPALLSIFSVFFSFTIIGLFILGSPHWKSGDDKPYGVFFLGVIVVTGMVTFGANVYGHISARYGGAEPPKVQLTLSPDASDEIRKLVLGAKDIYLVLDSDSSITLRLGVDTQTAQFLRIDKKAVSAVLFLNPPAGKKELPELFEKFRPLVEVTGSR